MTSKATTTTTTTPFQTSHDLRTLVSTSRSLLPQSEEYHPREERYWNHNDTHIQPLTHTETLGIQQLVLSPQRTLVATGGPRISFWSSPLDKSLHHKQQRFTALQIKAKQISTSGQLTTAVAFRHDGQLLAVGNVRGQVQIIQCATRAVLTTWQCSSLPVRAVVWEDEQTVWVGGDDARLSRWSLQSSPNRNHVSCTGHGDGITAIRMQDDHVVTASADHTVRLWNRKDDQDKRIEGGDPTKTQKEAVTVWRHAGPVQDMIWVPSQAETSKTACCITASGTELTVWSPDHIQPLQHVPTRHVKTITALCYILRRRRKTTSDNKEEDDVQHCVFTASLDGTLRLHEWNPQTRQLSPLIRLSLPSQQGTESTATTQHPITALTVFSHRGCVVLVCGFSHGHVLLRTTAPPPTVLKRRVVEAPAGTYAYFMRGPRVPFLSSSTGTSDDADTSTTVVATTGTKKRKYKSYDLCLKQFRYADALEEALATRNAQTVLNVLEALGQRPDGLETALSNVSTLEPILSFCLSFLRKQHTQHQHATALVLGVLNECWIRREDNEGEELWWKIRQAVQVEVQSQTCLLRTLGQIDGLLGTHALEGNHHADD